MSTPPSPSSSWTIWRYYRPASVVHVLPYLESTPTFVYLILSASSCYPKYVCLYPFLMQAMHKCNLGELPHTTSSLLNTPLICLGMLGHGQPVLIYSPRLFKEDIGYCLLMLSESSVSFSRSLWINVVFPVPGWPLRKIQVACFLQWRHGATGKSQEKRTKMPASRKKQKKSFSNCTLLPAVYPTPNHFVPSLIAENIIIWALSHDSLTQANWMPWDSPTGT